MKTKQYDCIYRETCNVPEMVICRGENYENCLVYKRRKLLEQDKPKSQIEKFMDRYPMWRYMHIGSMK